MPLSPEQWEQIDRLFHAALRLPEQERSRFLDDACVDAPELRAEVEALLEADALLGTDDESSGFAGGPGLGVEALLTEQPGVVPAPEGRQVGPYRIEREIGHGGMGIVYLAAHTEVGKPVALKLVRGGLASPEREARFMFERRLLARLQHPNIATLFDAGVSDGTPYYAMELVDGVPITEYCERERAGIRARLQLFNTVCDAVDYAHRNLIVHRDLKPSNILVNADGQVKLLDFGIAKLLGEANEEDAPVLTQTGLNVMTPEYAAPEQVRGEAITTATDVYALGVLLYELLTGRRPYRITSRVPSEVERIICQEEPRKPSTVAGERHDDAKESDRYHPTVRDERFQRRLRGDLDNIVLKALRKEPERRYPSASQLAADIRRYLDGRPVTARNDTFGYRARKFIGRNRAAVLSSAAVVLFVAGLVTFYTLRLAAENARVQREARKSEQITTFLTELFKGADPLEAGDRNTTVGEILDRGQARVAEELASQPELRIAMTGLIGEIYVNMGDHARADSLLVESRELALDQYGPDHLEVAEWTFQLGRLRALQGRFDEAEALIREALRIRRDQLGEKNVKVAAGLDQLGQIMLTVGRYDEAEVNLSRALAILQEIDGPRGEETAVALHNLAGVYFNKGDYSEAESLYRAALDIHRERNGEDHPSTLMGLNAVGLMLREQRRPVEADSYLTRAYEKGREALGPDHPIIATFASNLALTRQDLGDFSGAEQLFIEVLEADRRALGETHPYVGQDLSNLGFVLAEQGKRDEAANAYAEALQILRDAYGPSHPRIATTLMDAAQLAMSDGDFEKAEPMVRTAMEIRIEKLGADDVRTAEASALLGRIMQKFGRMDEAADLFGRAIPVFRSDELTPPSRLAEALSRYGQVLTALGRDEEAATVLEDCRSVLQTATADGETVECGAAPALSQVVD